MEFRGILLGLWLMLLPSTGANFYVCESGTPAFLGHYTQVGVTCGMRIIAQRNHEGGGEQDSTADGVPTFSNEEGMSVYRHQVISSSCVAPARKS